MGGWGDKIGIKIGNIEDKAVADKNSYLEDRPGKMQAKTDI